MVWEGLLGGRSHGKHPNYPRRKKTTCSNSSKEKGLGRNNQHDCWQILDPGPPEVSRADQASNPWLSPTAVKYRATFSNFQEASARQQNAFRSVDSRGEDSEAGMHCSSIPRHPSLPRNSGALQASSWSKQLWSSRTSPPPALPLSVQGVVLPGLCCPFQGGSWQRGFRNLHKHPPADTGGPTKLPINLIKRSTNTHHAAPPYRYTDLLKLPDCFQHHTCCQGERLPPPAAPASPAMPHLSVHDPQGAAQQQNHRKLYFTSLLQQPPKTLSSPW